MKVLSFEDGQEMLCPSHVSRPITTSRFVGQSSGDGMDIGFSLGRIITNVETPE